MKNKKIIILEGIATSGKTTILNLLKEKLTKQNISHLVIDEQETLMKIHMNTDKNIAIKHLLEILNKVLQKKEKIIIFDRLYFTHMFRTNSSIKDFKEIENLIKNDVKLYFLKIDEKNVEKRIFDAMKHRSKSWSEYVNNLGNKKQIINYYTNQQKKSIENLKISEIENEIINTTNLEFEIITRKIIENIKN